MLFSALLFAGLVAASTPLQARGVTIPVDCLSVCPAEASEIGAACAAYTARDYSYEEGCKRGCTEEIKEEMRACRKCIWRIDQVVAGQLELGNTVACLGGVMPSASGSSTIVAVSSTSKAPVIPSSSLIASSSASASASKNATSLPTEPVSVNGTGNENNGASSMTPVQAALVLGFFVAMI